MAFHPDGKRVCSQALLTAPFGCGISSRVNAPSDSTDIPGVCGLLLSHSTEHTSSPVLVMHQSESGTQQQGKLSLGL